MSLVDWTEITRAALRHIACERHEKISARPVEGCPWCEVERLNTMRTQCEHCGADYMATGIEAGCPCRLRAQLSELNKQHDIAVTALLRHGFIRCDIPACNCGSWHHVDGLMARWRELEDILEPRNGQTMLGRAKEIVGQLAEREQQLADAREAFALIKHTPTCLALYTGLRRGKCDCGVDALRRALAEPDA